MATDAGAAKGPFRPAPAALLPPIPLYRTLLRTHRKVLPVEQRLLGDMYVKAEFRAHKDIDNPVQIVGALTVCHVMACSNHTETDWLSIGMADVRTSTTRR